MSNLYKYLKKYFKKNYFYEVIILKEIHHKVKNIIYIYISFTLKIKIHYNCHRSKN